MSSHIETSEKTVEPKGRFAWRRLLRFRLLTLLVLITVVALVFGWWSHGARKQRKAVAALREVDCMIEYDFQIEELDRPKFWPAWLVDWLGKDYFADVNGLELSYSESYLDDGRLVHLDSLRTLEWLVLSSTPVNDESLEYVKHLRALIVLDLSDTKVSDDGLQHLKNLHELKMLVLSGTSISDNGLKHIEEVQALNQLDLAGTQITDKGLEHLEKMQSLESLFLFDTHVTDEGVTRMKEKLPNCKIIH